MASSAEMASLLANEILAAGFAKHVSKKADPSSRVLSLQDCLEIEKTLTGAETKDLKKILEFAAGKGSNRVVDTHVKIIQTIVSKVKNLRKTLFVSVGSTPDKLGMTLEYMGLDVVNVAFSRTFWQKRSGSLDAASEKMKQDFRKLVYLPIAAAFEKSRCHKIALLDFLDSGSSFMTIFTMMKHVDERLADKVFPIAIVDENVSKNAYAVQLVRMIPRSLFIDVKFDFWRFSKLTRCVPRVEGGKVVPLTKIQKCVCSTARIFVCVFILPKIKKILGRRRRPGSPGGGA